MRKTGTPTTYRESLRMKILETAMQLFKLKGIKAVRMDDIATEIAISKRTLYEIYSNKEDLLFECLRNENELLTKQLADYALTTENEMAVIAYFIKLRLKDLGSINPLFFTEMNKYERIMRFSGRTRKNSPPIRRCSCRRALSTVFSAATLITAS